MTTAAVPTKPKSATDELRRLQRIRNEASALASKIGTEHASKVRTQQELLDERRRLIYREPALVDHQGSPVEPDSAVAQIDRAIAELGGVDDLAAKLERARRIEQRAKQDADEHVAKHFSELNEARLPGGQAVAEAANEAARQLVAALDAYIAYHGESVQLTAPVQGIDGRCVPGINAAADFRRMAESVNLPAPVAREEA